MDLLVRGTGDPIVVVPGIQGRWPYVEATVDALARSHRVITFSLAGEPRGRVFDPASGLENYVDDLDDAMNAAGVERATLVGISFGGVVALRFASTRPERVRALVLVSTPGPSWAPTGRHRAYVRRPWLFGSLFLIESPFRAGPEIRAALPSWGARARFSARQTGAFLRAPLSFRRMAARALVAAAADRHRDARAIAVPTLIVTGEPHLDRVVPVDGTRQYTALIRGARLVTMTGTGHLGSLTEPGRFAAIVDAFLEELHDAAA
jgi:pimeloyl-ACP methyl ester carboxylesterase